MSDRILQHRRLHHLLLLQKHFTLRESTSPFTLILDSVEQSAKPLIQRYIHNAKAIGSSTLILKINVIFVSYETLLPPVDITYVIKARQKDPATVQKEIAAAISLSKRTLLIIDTLYPLLDFPTLPTFLSSLIRPQPPTNLLAIYHQDIPPPAPASPYSPPPLSLLTYLATAIFTTHSLPQIISRRRAAEKSLPEPTFGLAEEKDGVIIGLSGGMKREGLVLEAEFRRKSGRGTEEWFFLPTLSGTRRGMAGSGEEEDGEKLEDGKEPILLDDHPIYRWKESGPAEKASDMHDVNALGGNRVDSNASTFELRLTEKQRRDREGVVLPYFDAQKGKMGEGGEGGRILYEFGVEDDFDEEEDEI